MNFFKLYMGDYQRDTGSLSITEHGAYFLMLQHHYATEKPLPKGRDLYRLLRCESKSDRAAVDAVVGAYWKETPDGLVNERAEREIAVAQEIEGDSEERKRNERERQRRHRERRKQMYDALRARGVTPPFDATTEDLNALLNGDDNVSVTRDITLDATAIHSHTQTPVPKQRKSKALSGKPDLRTPAIEILNFLNMKAHRAYRLTEGNLGLIMARLKDGATVGDCKQVIAKKVRDWTGNEEMQEYLRPETLFNRTKFDSYVGSLVLDEDEERHED